MPTRRRFRRRIASLAIVLNAASFVANAQTPCEPCTQARALRAEGKSKDAAALLKKAAKESKESAEFQGLVVMCALDLKRPQDAGAALTKFLEKQPSTELLAEVREAAAKAAPSATSLDVTMRTPEGAQPPILVVYSRTAYPTDVRELGTDATVHVDATIGTDGTAKQVEVRPEGNAALRQQIGLDDAAVSAIRRWRFFPALLDGRPVEASMTVIGTFELR